MTIPDINVDLFRDATVGDDVQRVAVPYYGFPAWFTSGSDWNRMRALAPYVDIVVANPASGPGTTLDTDYQTAIKRAQASGIRVLGYVDAGFPGSGTAVSIATAKSNVDLWYSLYAVDGIFFDEMSYDAVNVSWAQQMFAYVRGKGGMVVINPGTLFVEEIYMASCDIVMNWEGFATDYAALTTSSWPTWTFNYPSSRFWHCVHDCATTTTRDTLLASMKTYRAGHVFITNGLFSSGNPYAALPSDPYFSGMVAAIK